MFMRIHSLFDDSGRKSLEFEDLFSLPPSQDHHYEDILGQPHTWYSEQDLKQSGS